MKKLNIINETINWARMDKGILITVDTVNTLNSAIWLCNSIKPLLASNSSKNKVISRLEKLKRKTESLPSRLKRIIGVDRLEKEIEEIKMLSDEEFSKFKKKKLLSVINHIALSIAVWIPRIIVSINTKKQQGLNYKNLNRSIKYIDSLPKNKKPTYRQYFYGNY